VTDQEITTELVIPTYNRLVILKETLRQVRILYPDLDICLGIQGDMPDNAFEAQLKGDRHLRIEKLREPGTAAALNHCIWTSRADVILIMDDDSIPHFGWLEAHRSAFVKDPALAYTSGREVRFAKGRSSFSDWIRILLEGLFGLFLGKDKIINGRIVAWTNRIGLIFANFDQPGICTINAPRGCNMALRREAFRTFGGFNENFRGNAWGFEAEYGLRMARHGRYGQYRGDAIVIHHEASSGGSREAKEKRWFNDFLFNHMLLIQVLGPQAWFGSLPRLIKKRFFR
jgi:GT2 family glycosyltransferase